MQYVTLAELEQWEIELMAMAIKASGYWADADHPRVAIELAKFASRTAESYKALVRAGEALDLGCAVFRTYDLDGFNVCPFCDQTHRHAKRCPVPVFLAALEQIGGGRDG